MKKIYNIGDCIFSPLGCNTNENIDAVLHRRSALRLHKQRFHLPEPFFASIFEEGYIDDLFVRYTKKGEIRYTKLEKMAIMAAAGAIQQAGIDAAAEDTIFILSTTKGNVELLENNLNYEPERIYLWRSAQLIAQYFGNKNEPLIISNACISGCAAQIAAARLLENLHYQYAIVIGADVLSQFIISGFQSFKALSPELCKPFDAERTGLNLGEAAAAIVYTSQEEHPKINAETMCLCEGAICNDANHISGPSRTAEGLHAAIETTLDRVDKKQLAFINAHGTATRYNDDMESIAIQRSRLSGIPVNSLKGYYGHTLGAAGILEVILSSQAVLQKRIIATRGTRQVGTTAPITVAHSEGSTTKTAFLKLISGFGGGNAALLIAQKGGITLC